MRKPVLEAVARLYARLGRPVCLADLKAEFDIREKYIGVRGRSPAIEGLMRHLRGHFDEGRLSRTREMVVLPGYPCSPYASRAEKVIAHVHLYAPAGEAGKAFSFQWEGREVTGLLVGRADVQRTPRVSRIPAITEILQASDRALAVNEVLERYHQKLGTTPPQSYRAHYNATTSLLSTTLKPMGKRGLKRLKLGNRWLFFFTDDQLRRYKEHLAQTDPILRAAADALRGRKCVSLNQLASVLTLSHQEIEWRIATLGKHLEPVVRVTETGEEGQTREQVEIVHVRDADPSRVAFIEWLGYLTPIKEGERYRGKRGSGYEAFIVDLRPDWQEALRHELEKSRRHIPERALRGIFYERFVQRVFQHLCTSKELQQSPLAGYMVPFVFREKVTNVWMVSPSGRRMEFDVLIKGTFNAFNAMTKGEPFLDFSIPIESKYTTVLPEHVSTFAEKIKSGLRDQKTVFPILIGFNWSKESIGLAHHYNIRILYFRNLDNLIREMTGANYRFEQEWNRVEEMFQAGLTRDGLRERLEKQDFTFLFEEHLRQKLNRNGRQ